MSALVLERALPPEQQRFEAVLRALGRADGRSHAFAELHDLLTGLASSELPTAVASADLSRLDAYLQNYVAALVEQAADQKGLVPPTWVRDVEPLTEPHFATDLPGLRRHLLAASPVPFRRRNLFVDSALGDRV
jgi:hypothetical protein